MCSNHILCQFVNISTCMHGTGLPACALRLTFLVFFMKNVNFECKDEQLPYINKWQRNTLINTTSFNAIEMQINSAHSDRV